MHVYFLTRGAKHEVDRFITELQGKYLSYEYSKGKFGNVALGVRPIQLWEVVFPEQHLQTILKTIADEREEIENGNKYGINNAQIFALRKILKADKLPTIEPKTLGFPIYKKNIQILKIGSKKDVFMYDREML